LTIIGETQSDDLGIKSWRWLRTRYISTNKETIPTKRTFGIGATPIVASVPAVVASIPAVVASIPAIVASVPTVATSVPAIVISISVVVTAVTT